MPRTGHKSSPGLAILIEHAQPFYFPGDTLIGYIIGDGLLNQQSIFASVQLTPSGRARTKYVDSNNGNKSVYRGRAVFFNDSRLYVGTAKVGGPFPLLYHKPRLQDSQPEVIASSQNGTSWPRKPRNLSKKSM